MDYRESLAYLYGLQQFGIKLGLDNIRGLLDTLAHPENQYPIVHVGGSNGKGSVSATLARILREAGLRTGLYTSPHLHSFTERIQVDGRPIDENEVGRLTEFIRRHCREIPATFFEFTTAMALLYFQQQAVDVAVIEVGMGGRLDATNAVHPRVTVITPVCLDHVEHLGADLAAIAGEKAGIIKQQVPLVLGAQDPEALSVLQEQAKVRGAPVFLFDRDFSVSESPKGFSYKGLDLALEELEPGLPGRHQWQNMSLSLAAAELLQRQGMVLPAEALRRGVAGVSWPGRLEWWRGGDRMLLDGAHNEGGARVLADYLRSLPVGGIRWVVGIKAKKDVHSIFASLLPLVNGVYAAPAPVDRPVAAEELRALAAEAGVAAKSFESTGEALQAALAEQRPGEIILVAGSLFLVAAARDFLLSQEETGS
ncbi:MAG: folylpolyglutamate synthase/dihydrofolate synthase family protein [Syntrophotaleaceae bacterium]